jgi:D-methionine transport system ATP-binding protein
MNSALYFEGSSEGLAELANRPVAEPIAEHRDEPDQAHVVIRDVNKTYTTGAISVDALRNINLTIGRGEIFGIIGRSGAGKSSLIRTLNRLEDISSGQVLINNIDVGSLRERDLVILRRKVGMIFQHFNLLHSKTVFENLALSMKAAGIRDKAVIRQRIDELLTLVGLEGKAQVYPSRLSGGQKQRVGIARALMLKPKLLLCDEATSALDPETTHSILGLLKDIRDKLGLTIILITHEMSVISEICDRVAVLEQGEVVESGPVWKIFSQPQHEATRALLAPLRKGLPDALLADLKPKPGHTGSRAVVRLTLAGSGQTELPLHLLASLGTDTKLLQSDIEYVQGHVMGRLLVSLPTEDGKLPESFSTPVFSDTEVLGYVTSTA